MLLDASESETTSSEESFINIRKLYERFCHEKSNDQR